MAPLLSTLKGVTIETDHDKVAQDTKVRWLPLLSVPGMLGMTPGHRAGGRALPRGGAGARRRLARAARHRLQDRHQLGVRPFRQAAFPAARHSAREFCVARRAAGRATDLAAKGRSRGADRAKSPFGHKIATLDADPAADADFFLDTAAIMMNLDLVVTCDTSVTHLAGALARPVFVALPVVADWRWMIGREDSPWYPSCASSARPRPAAGTRCWRALPRPCALLPRLDLDEPIWNFSRGRHVASV